MPGSPPTLHAPTQVERGAEVPTPDALAFLTELQRRFGPRRDELLVARERRREEIARTGRLDVLSETREVREGQWRVAEAPVDLRAREAWDTARRLFVECALDPGFPAFLTIPAYQETLAREGVDGRRDG